MMKNHFLSRFDARNLWKTNIYFAIAVVLITISFVGEYINDRGDLNGLMILMFIIGFVLFFYAMLHPWGKVSLLFHPDCDFHRTFFTFTECWNWYTDKDGIR